MQRARRANVLAAATLAPLVLLGLAACGSDERAQAVAALKSQIVANNAMQSRTAVSDQQAACIAQGAVDRITVEGLQDYRILTDDLDVEKAIDQVPLSSKDADGLAAVYLDCSDAEKIFEDRLISGLAPRKPAARARVARCVRRTVTADSVRRILAQSFAKSDTTAYADLSDELGDCRA